MITTTAVARIASRAEFHRWNGAPDSVPANFDPAIFPILAQHWFGTESVRSKGEVAAGVVADLTFRRKVERLHALGPRVTAELLAEIGAERSIQTTIDQKLERFAGLEPEVLEVSGGDKFWPAPLHEVWRTP